MLLNIDTKLLTAFLNTNEDCSALGGGEYIADLYDAPRPLTLDILMQNDKALLLAAASLLYDEEQDGWYMGDQVSDEAEILRALNDAINNNA
ncbi:MAG: hypothetical protein IJU28_06715 [Clostridia bacterium]|nr:hypothetical protein [Clostridia bacterium]